MQMKTYNKIIVVPASRLRELLGNVTREYLRQIRNKYLTEGRDFVKDGKNIVHLKSAEDKIKKL